MHTQMLSESEDDHVVVRCQVAVIPISAAFLRLSVFETIDKTTNDIILRCKDNRRLFALKEYAKRTGNQRVMINVNLFKLKALKEFKGFVRNSDKTHGRDIELRRFHQQTHRWHGDWQHGSRRSHK